MKSDFYDRAIDPADPLYPDILRQVLKKPLTLYYRGDFELLSRKNLLAVVGSRRPEFAARRALDYVLRPLAGIDLVIVSGLAIGLDSQAHRVALKNRLPTVAILGSGVGPSDIYPSSNRGLAEEILAAGGLLISPFPTQTPVQSWNFPIRNQLIAALPKATLVAAAAAASGARITARLALEYGRDVFVIPGAVDDPGYAGSNELLQQGAFPVLRARDLMEYFSIEQPAAARFPVEDAVSRAILQLVGERHCNREELPHLLGKNGTEIRSALSKLELENLLRVDDDGTLVLLA